MNRINRIVGSAGCDHGTIADLRSGVHQEKGIETHEQHEYVKQTGFGEIVH